MMKKSLCVVFVLALIAQICARPVDEKVDPEKKAEDEVVTEAKVAKHKGDDVVDKVTKAAKGIVDRKKKEATDAVKHGEEAANHFKKHGNGEDCHKPGAIGPHGGIISGQIKQAARIGEGLVKRGEEVIEKLFESMGL